MFLLTYEKTIADKKLAFRRGESGCPEGGSIMMITCFFSYDDNLQNKTQNRLG